MIIMELTGERIVPDLMDSLNGMLLEHLARYYFSFPYVEGRVLDIACGVGYGSFMVAKGCKERISEVVGVDNDSKTLRYAFSRYNHQKVKYVMEDVLSPLLPEVLGQFDTILSFETIEHVADYEVFLKNLEGMLRPGGRLILSTPFGQGIGKPTSELFHVHQFTEEEFFGLFENYGEVQSFYQRGVVFERAVSGRPPRDDVRYPLGLVVCRKD